MKHYIQIMLLFACFMGKVAIGMAQSPCFAGLPVTGTYADPATSDSPNKNRVFWLTWGANHAESTSTYPYGKSETQLNVGAKSYGSIDLGGGRYMCLEAEITSLSGGSIKSYIPGTYVGDFLVELYNKGGKNNNKMASAIMNRTNDRTINIVIKVKAKVNNQPVRLRGFVLSGAESLAPNESIIASGVGDWSVAEVRKNIGKGAYNVRKEDNNSGTQSIVFARGNDQKTGAIAFLTFKNRAYIGTDFTVELSSQFKGGGFTAIAFGLLTSGYDFGDAPESYGKPIHLIDDIDLGNDGINPVKFDATQQVKDASIVNVNDATYNPALLTYSVSRYLGSTPPDEDTVDMFSVDAKGDDNFGSAGSSEEDAWPVQYRQFADKEYKPGDKITAVIPYKKALKDDVISGWIDFNLNGTFDPSERVTKIIPADGDGNLTLEWTVPSTRVAYSTYVRLRYFGRGDQDTTSPIGNALNGEVEDHRIYILTQGSTNPALPSKSKTP